jgi:hypothetical protein
MRITTESVKNVCVAIAVVVIAVCLIIITRHSTALEDQQRTDTSVLEQHASKVLTQWSVVLQAEQDQTEAQLQKFNDQQSEIKALLKKFNIIADTIIGVHGATGILGDVKADVVALGVAINENSKASKETLAAAQVAIGAIGPAVASVQHGADNLAGLIGETGSAGTARGAVAQVSALIGVPGSTVGGTLSASVATFNAAGKSITAIMGVPGQTGTVGGITTHFDNIAANADQVVQDATHPKKLPFWKMVAVRVVAVALPDLAHSLLSRWLPPSEQNTITNLPKQ